MKLKSTLSESVFHDMEKLAKNISSSIKKDPGSGHSSAAILVASLKKMLKSKDDEKYNEGVRIFISKLKSDLSKIK